MISDLRLCYKRRIAARLGPFRNSAHAGKVLRCRGERKDDLVLRSHEGEVCVRLFAVSRWRPTQLVVGVDKFTDKVVSPDDILMKSRTEARAHNLISGADTSSNIIHVSLAVKKSTSSGPRPGKGPHTSGPWPHPAWPVTKCGYGAPEKCGTSAVGGARHRTSVALPTGCSSCLSRFRLSCRAVPASPSAVRADARLRTRPPESCR